MIVMRDFFPSDGTWAHSDCFDPEGEVPYNESDAFLVYNYTEKDTMTPVESYWK